MPILYYINDNMHTWAYIDVRHILIKLFLGMDCQ